MKGDFMRSEMSEADIQQVVATGEFLPPEHWEEAMSVPMVSAPTFNGQGVVAGEG